MPNTTGGFRSKTKFHRVLIVRHQNPEWFRAKHGSSRVALTQVVSVGDDEGEVDGPNVLFVQGLVEIFFLRTPEPFELRVRGPVGFDR